LAEPAKGDWYSNKDLYEMMVELSKGLETTNAELGKTQVLIRDYNGLREKIAELEAIVNSFKNTKKDLRWWATIGVALAAVVVAIIK